MWVVECGCGRIVWLVMAAFMGIRMQKIEREREFIFIFRGYGVVNLSLTFTKYKAFDWLNLYISTMC